MELKHVGLKEAQQPDASNRSSASEAALTQGE